MQKKKGISLIVLVITIIVMIILAAAIILSLNNAGIIGNANKAVDESNMANIKTEADLAYAEYLIDKPIVEDLGEYLTEKLVNNGTIKGKEQDYYIKVIDGEATVIKEGSTADKFFDKDIKIGDYIEYDPAEGVTNASTVSYTSNKTENGYANQTFTLTGSYDNTTYGWQVMGVGKGGELLLLSEDFIQPTTAVKTENGKNLYAIGTSTREAGTTRVEYLNAVDELNNICSIFGRGYGATGARSITVDDINKITGYNPNRVGNEDNKPFGEDLEYEYNNKVTYYWVKTADEIMKVEYESSNSKNGELSYEHEFFEWYDGNKYCYQKAPEDLATGEKRKITTIVTDYYFYFPETLTEEKESEKKGEIKQNTVIYNMLFNETNEQYYYWLASRFVNHNTAGATFGIRHAWKDRIVGQYLFASPGVSAATAKGIRAVVSLESDITLVKTIDTETADTYIIQK